MLFNNYRAFSMLLLLCVCAVLGCDEPAGEKKNRNAQPLMVVEKVDADFVVMANDVINAEINAGKLAMEKGTDKRIRNFGRIMVKDYNKRLDKLRKLATDKRIPLPDSFTAQTASNIAGLKSKAGNSFDQAYINYISTNHKNAIGLYEQAQKNCFDKDVKTTARKGILIFKRRLEAISAIHDSMK